MITDQQVSEVANARIDTAFSLSHEPNGIISIHKVPDVTSPEVTKDPEGIPVITRKMEVGLDIVSSRGVKPMQKVGEVPRDGTRMRGLTHPHPQQVRPHYYAMRQTDGSVGALAHTDNASKNIRASKDQGGVPDTARHGVEKTPVPNIILAGPI